MRINRYVISLAALLLALPVFFSEAIETPEPVKAKIISDVSTVSPGDTFNLGVLFEVEPGWHIYWKNPGDSGLPTVVEFNNAVEINIEKELNWPVPQSYEAEGGIVDYGYEDALLLWTGVSIPDDYKGKELNISSLSSWVSCREICIPGRAELNISIPVSERTNSEYSNLFSKWEARLPIDVTNERSPIKMKYETAPVDKNKSNISIVLKHKEDVSEIELFPAPGPGVEIENISYENSPTITKINLELRALDGDKPAESELDTLIVFKRDGVKAGVRAPLLIVK